MATRSEAVASSNHEEVGDRAKMLSTIVECLSRSRENESWGLMVEAAEDYQRSAVNVVGLRVM